MRSNKFYVFEFNLTQIYFKPFIFNSRDKLFNKKRFLITQITEINLK